MLSVKSLWRNFKRVCQFILTHEDMDDISKSNAQSKDNREDIVYNESKQEPVEVSVHAIDGLS